MNKVKLIYENWKMLRKRFPSRGIFDCLKGAWWLTDLQLDIKNMRIKKGLDAPFVLLDGITVH